MKPLRADLRSAPLKAAAIAALILLLAVVTWITPPKAVEFHNVLHHLNFLPFMIAGFIFGWRGALQALLFAFLVQAPIIAHHWKAFPLDAQDEIVELSVFGAAGIIAGFLSDQERLQRARLETTKGELEHVYIELRQHIEQMKKTERLSAAGQLAASLAHEIRNPLASISGAAGILMRGQASAEYRNECLEILTRESQRLNKLLTNFLDFARPKLPRLQKIEPVALVQSVATLAAHSAMLKDVRLVQDSPSSLREVDCDPERIKQVLLNLILNAVQATEGDGVVRIRSSIAPGGLRIEVCDQGCGIPEEEQERVFDPFYTTKESGTGLGLAVAANIVAQHGGVLACRSNPGRGMTFWMELPWDRPQAEQHIRLREKGAVTQEVRPQ